MFTLQVAIRTAFKGPQRVSPVLEASHGAPRAAQQAGSGPQCEHMWILNTDVLESRLPQHEESPGTRKGTPLGTTSGFSDDKMEGRCVSRFGASTGALRP